MRIIAVTSTAGRRFSATSYLYPDTKELINDKNRRSLLISALLIGSALIIVAKIPPFWGEIPVIGTLGFCISGLLSIAVLLDDYRKRKLFLRERLRRKRLEEEERNR